MDTIKRLAEERFFHTVEVHLEDFGDALVIGDRSAVERLIEVIREHDDHTVTIENDTGDEPLS